MQVEGRVCVLGQMQANQLSVAGQWRAFPCKSVLQEGSFPSFSRCTLSSLSSTKHQTVLSRLAIWSFVALFRSRLLLSLLAELSRPSFQARLAAQSHGKHLTFSTTLALLPLCSPAPKHASNALLVRQLASFYAFASICTPFYFGGTRWPYLPDDFARAF